MLHAGSEGVTAFCGPGRARSKRQRDPERRWTFGFSPHSDTNLGPRVRSHLERVVGGLVRHRGGGEAASRRDVSASDVVRSHTPDRSESSSCSVVVLAGNASTQFDEPYRSPYRLVHERIESLGLENISVPAQDGTLDGCPCGDDPFRHIRTLAKAQRPGTSSRASLCMQESTVMLMADTPATI